MAEHTPGELRLSPRRTYKFPTLVIGDGNGQAVATGGYGSNLYGNSQANMERLALCWNTHDDLLTALEAYQCRECRGRGRVDTPCPDPQCGDSTWDHECGLGSRPCSNCGGVTADELARAAITKAGGG